MDKWNERFLNLAFFVASWSKNPTGRYGAVLVDKRKRVLSVGYNGFPRGVKDLQARLNDAQVRRSLTVFAEENAILQYEGKIELGSVLYSTGFPPLRAAKQIAQRGISRVVCPESEHKTEDVILSGHLLKEAGVEVVHCHYRADFLCPGNWDLRFLGVAQIVASWSKDPSTKVGAVIVDDKKRILSVGYNGFPRGLRDEPHWLSDKKMKYAFICHAEENALAQCETPVLGKTALYVSLFPCADCAKLIIQRGITQVYAPQPDFSHPVWGPHFLLSASLLKESGVRMVMLNGIFLSKEKYRLSSCELGNEHSSSLLL